MTKSKKPKRPSDPVEAQLYDLRKVLAPGVPEDLEALDRSGLMKVIADCEDNVREQESAMAEDEELAAARQQARDYAAGYRDAIKAQRAKQRYASIMLDSKGGVS